MRTAISTASVSQGACTIGPFARLRPGTELADGVHIGNFVETKKTRLGKGSKANHLSYLGDAEIGVGVNIGAGTITCNYDGVNKFATQIGDGAFIGSNSSLVAPVSIGKDATIGAGSVITKDAPRRRTDRGARQAVEHQRLEAAEEEKLTPCAAALRRLCAQRRGAVAGISWPCRRALRLGELSESITPWSSTSICWLLPMR